MGESSPQLRIGDRERFAVDARLQAAVGDGVLSLHEYDARSAALWRARTRPELDELVADLPAEDAGPSSRASGGGPRRRVVAVLSDDRFAGALAPGQDVRGYAVLGKAVVDLRRGDLPDGVRVQVRSVLGDVEVQVPPGAVVHLSGLSLLGERTVAVPEGSGPNVHVDAVAVLGSVHVTAGDGRVVPHLRHGTRHGPRPAPGPPVTPAASGPPARRPSPARPRAWGLGRVKALLVPVAVLGAVLLAGPDASAVFGSSVERVAPERRDVQVSALFGSVTVVVPDGTRVDPRTFVLFGSAQCEDACGAGQQGPDVEVRALGGFGSVEIVTESEYAERSGSNEPEVDGVRSDD